MKRKLLIGVGVCLVVLLISAMPAAAQTRFSFGFSFGPAVVQPYGYYGYYPPLYSPFPVYGYYGYYQPYSSYYYYPAAPAYYYPSYAYPYPVYRYAPRAHGQVRTYVPRRYHRPW